jgi:hypothetical protein
VSVPPGNDVCVFSGRHLDLLFVLDDGARTLFDGWFGWTDCAASVFLNCPSASSDGV